MLFSAMNLSGETLLESGQQSALTNQPKNLAADERRWTQIKRKSAANGAKHANHILVFDSCLFAKFAATREICGDLP